MVDYWFCSYAKASSLLVLNELSYSIEIEWQKKNRMTLCLLHAAVLQLEYDAHLSYGNAQSPVIY